MTIIKHNNDYLVIWSQGENHLSFARQEDAVRFSERKFGTATFTHSTIVSYRGRFRIGLKCFFTLKGALLYIGAKK